MNALNTLVAHPAPLRTDEHGVIRVGETRVTLETVLTAFKNGFGAEEIVLKYPTLNLTDVYAVIAYYLWNRSGIDAYLEHVQREANTRYEEYETHYPTVPIRERLLKTRSDQTS